MNEHDDKLDRFLKKTVAAPPPAPIGEKQRIWRAIEAEQPQTAWWRSLSIRLPELRFIFPLASALVLTLVIMAHQKHKHEAAGDRALAAALDYQIEELEDSNSPL
jgi:hypothetical protein